LIHRPAVGSTLGTKSSPSVISLAESSKHIIQIVQLLEERSMSFSFCLNKNEMLTLCGLSLLYQGLDLKQDGKLMQDSQRLVVVVIKYLQKSNAPGAADFKRLAASMVKLDEPKVVKARTSESNVLAPTSSKSTLSPSIPMKPLKPQLYRHGSATVSESDLLSQQAKLRRATMPNITPQRQDTHHHGRNSIESARSESPTSKREYRGSAPQLPTLLKPRSNTSTKPPNLDYLSLSNTPVASQPTSPLQSRNQQAQSSHTPAYPTSAYAGPKAATATPTEWEVLLGSFDDRHLYDAIYGGGPGAAPALSFTDTSSSQYGGWSPESFDMTSLNMGDFTSGIAPPQSVLSFSEDSLSSGGEETSASELSLPGPGQLDYRHSLSFGNTSSEQYLLDGLDATFGL
jgi:hypothetical protein